MSDDTDTRVPNILVVEDSKIAQMAVKIIITAHPCTLSMAENEAEALRLANSQFFDVILMDIGLGASSGFDVTQNIRSHSTFNQHTLIFALTAHADPEFHKKSFESEMDGYFVKPFSPMNMDEVLLALYERAHSLPPAYRR